jgi:DNA adenine methylase
MGESDGLGFHEQLRAIRYIGGKIRLMVRLRPVLQSVGGEFFVDVFGGSGAVTMGSGFDKRVFNDVDGDVVHFFRVLADPVLATAMFRKLKRLPMARELFDGWNAVYVDGGKSFSALGDVDRAVAFFYRSAFAYGGKVRNGGFAASLGDRSGCKEIKRYRNVMRRMAELRRFWEGTVIENLDFEKLVRSYGTRRGALLFCDPPYFGTERYYSRDFPAADHERLASVVMAVPAKVVMTYYETPEIRALYPQSHWRYVRMESVKNSMRSAGSKGYVNELVLVKRDAPTRSVFHSLAEAARIRKSA